MQVGKVDQERMIEKMKLDMETAAVELEALERANMKRDAILGSLATQVILVREQVRILNLRSSDSRMPQPRPGCRQQMLSETVRLPGS